MPLSKALMAVNIKNAFILSSLSSAITALVAVNSKQFFTDLLDRFEKGMGKSKTLINNITHNKDNSAIESEEEALPVYHQGKIKYKGLISTLIAFIFTFIVSFIVFSILWFTIGFGGSMLTSCETPGGRKAVCKWS